MSAGERRATTALAGIFTLRMLGLFMIFPVLSLHAYEYPDTTPLLIGLAISAYGLTQAIFQIPFGMLSDRIGRKPVITLGLILFALGSVVAALADTMWGVVGGRALQGVGAIAAAVMALTADLTREEHRTKAMAVIGVSIGMAFVLAQVIGPAVAGPFGLSGLFWLTAVLAIGGIAVLYLHVPDPVESSFHRDTEPVLAQFWRIIRMPELLRLDGGILVLHFVMTANTVVVPLALRDQAGVSEAHFWLVYLIVLGISVLLMIPTIIYAERNARLKHALIWAIAVLGVSQAGLAALPQVLLPLVGMLVVYFYAFNVLEATLPSLVSRLSPADLKGTSLAAYSSAQYLGAFLGGPLGGWLYGQYGSSAVFLTCGLATVAWLLLAAGMRNPPPVSTRLIRLGALGDETVEKLTGRLLAIRGVTEVVVNAQDGMAYVKVDQRHVDEDALRAFSVAGA